MKRALPIAGSRVALSEPVPPRPMGWGDAPSALSDSRGRTIEYLRISIADRCDMACVYCMPPGGEDEHAPRADLLTFEEIVLVAQALARGGVRRIRLTGGEPLVRKDAVRLVARLRDGTDAELAMTTNGARLGALARPLRDAGLDQVNVSIDSLDRDRFAAITRGGDLAEVLAGVRAAIDVGLEVKLNTVALGGVNDDELGAIVDWAWSIGAVPRFIELMPIGEGASLPSERFLGARDIVQRLGARVSDGPLERSGNARGPARYLRDASGSDRRVGLITAVTDDFCDGCNRVRLTSRGDLRACLASRRTVSLRDVVRAGGDARDVLWATAWSLGAKEAGHRFSDADEREHQHVGMSLIGG